MRWTRFVVGVLAAMLAWANLVSAQEPSGRSASPGIRVLRDLPYVEGGHEQQRLDLYLPEKDGARRPLVVWVHGGGWEAGRKEDSPAQWLVGKGYTVASVNYRLSQQAVFPAQLHDCKAAIRWLRANAAKYRLDPDRVGVAGDSAGGHLVALLGATGGVKELEGNLGNLDQSSRIQAVVDFYGPTDFVRWDPGFSQYAYSVITRLIGGAPQENKEKARKASSVTYVDKDSAPFLILHGDKDGIVPLAQSQELAEALKKAGVEVNLRVVKGSGHGGPTYLTPEKRKLIDEFFAKHLGKG
jgi:acetyl esterase/lipase